MLPGVVSVIRPVVEPVQDGLPLPPSLRHKMESQFGTDFSAVRIHEGPQAEHMGATAYTRGNDIYFAPGRYDPGSQQGREMLGHELAHVVQQAQGRVAINLGSALPGAGGAT